jgi:hypothetical protein
MFEGQPPSDQDEPQDVANDREPDIAGVCVDECTPLVAFRGYCCRDPQS